MARKIVKYLCPRGGCFGFTKPRGLIVLRQFDKVSDSDFIFHVLGFRLVRRACTP